MAKTLGISQSTITNLENGKIELFSIAKLGIIADFLDVTLDELLCDSIYKFKNKSTTETLFYKQKLKEIILNLDNTNLQFAENFLNNFLIYQEKKRS